MPERASFVGVLVNFAAELRSSGLAVGSGDVLTYCAAMAPLDPTDLLDLYWAGRATLVTRRENIPVYDEVFRKFFLADGDPVREMLTLKAHVTAEAEAMLEVPATDPAGDGHEEEATLGLMASDAEALRHKSFAACTPEELAAVRRIMARIRLTPPKRRTRRAEAARSGRSPDLRRTVRESMRMHGEPAELYWCWRKVRLRPLILILDVSGSMADYSRNLLHATSRSASASSSGRAARISSWRSGTSGTTARRRAGPDGGDEAPDGLGQLAAGGRAGEPLRVQRQGQGRLGRDAPGQLGVQLGRMNPAV